MIDLNSPEFYTIAFVVAMAMLAFFFGHREKRPPSTYIVQLNTTPVEKEETTEQSESSQGECHQNSQLLADEEDSEDLLIMEPLGGGRIQVRRTGLSLGDEETANLVITVQEEQCTIIEKKGVKRRRAVPQPVTGEATLRCLRPGTKYRIRYESQLTSAWASFTFDTASPIPVKVTLKY